MDAVLATLRRLRRWFLVWFIAEAVAGTTVAVLVLDGLSRWPLVGSAIGGANASVTVLAGFGVSLVLLLLALPLLEALVALRPWARTVMLVIGWITAVSSALEMLTFPAGAALLESMEALGRGDWRVLWAAGQVTNVADLVFWSWVIYVLQIKPGVREAFVCPDQREPGADAARRAGS